jgi:UPF0755 protein
VWLRALARLFAAAALVAVLAAAGLGWFVWSFREPGPLEAEAVVEVPRGAGLRGIADRLADAGVIDDPRLFTFGAWLYGRADDLRAGEYAFPPHVSAEGAMALLVQGRTVSYAVTVPEGLTSAEIVTLLREDDRLTGEVAEVPPEGALLPETYHFRRGDTREDLLDRMADAMDDAVAALWAERAEGVPLASPEEAVVLASIIEKETGVPDERDTVASVFINRLDRGMPLQSDPTVIYALTQGAGPLGRPLLRSDIEQTDSPYNTYRVDGLPPGPIANPGRAAIAAALNPAETEYLYFVADGTGGHAFARTFEEHRQNVRRWRRVRDGQGQGQGQDSTE